MTTLLAGDIGGTKTILAIFSHENGAHAPLAQQTFPSNRYRSLEAIAVEFLRHHRCRIDTAVFGVAGPVVNDRAHITNLPWEIDAEALRASLRLPRVILLNDLVAVAHGIPYLPEEDIHTLASGWPVVNGSLAVIAPGTGLGEAFLSWSGTGYRVHGSEGGHTDFGPVDELQVDLLRYLLAREGHVSYERVCSGIGLPNIYDFLRESGRYPEPDSLARRLAQATDRTPVIVDAAVHAGDEYPICTATVRIFVDILGAEAGNLALTVMATGGVYLGGGIPPRILPFLREERFMRAFLAKGRFTDLLETVPVHVILNSGAALFGAACRGLAGAGPRFPA